MVMSFQGQQAKPETDQPHIEVKDFMTTKVTTFKWNHSLAEAIQILLEKDISGGPVLDANDKLVGIVSEGDCLKQVVKGKYFNSPSLSIMVSEFMDTDVKTVSPSLNILDAAQMFLQISISLEWLPNYLVLVVDVDKDISQTGNKNSYFDDINTALHSLRGWSQG